MIKIVYTFVALGFLLLNPANSYYDADVPADFREMLASPTTFRPSPGTSLVTKVTAPFVQDVTPVRRRGPKPSSPSLDIFANPTAAAWQIESGTKMNPHQIFDVIGKSRRGLLSDQRYARYQGITNAQTSGLLGIVQGKSFRLRQTAATPAQQEEMARELLNIGYLMPDEELSRALAEFQSIYTSGRLTPAQQSHIQISAMLMLKGSNSRIEDGAWYLKGRDKDRALRKVNGFAARFLPIDVVVGGSGTDGSENIVSPLLYGSGFAPHYGTPDIKASALNGDALNPRFSNVMALGNSDNPTSSPSKSFSISIRVRPNEYLVITRPESDKNIALLPAYMEVAVNTLIDPLNRLYPEEISGEVLVNILSSKGANIRLADNHVRWSTTFKNNSGKLIFDSLSIPYTYSFLASVTKTRDRKDKLFYYWCPTYSQIKQLQLFAKRKVFSAEELITYIETELTDHNAVPPEILAGIKDFIK